MARCLKGEGSAEDERMLAEMLLLHEDLEKEYEIFRGVLQSWGAIHPEPNIEYDLPKKFEDITRRLQREELL
jgi:radical SAM superfamily enzyme YgiQ (UPF0313 family)